MILDPGFDLTLRPMKYPVFYEMYKNAIKNTWTVDEVDFSKDTNDLKSRMSENERHLISRLVAFFATTTSPLSRPRLTFVLSGWTLLMSWMKFELLKIVVNF